MDGAEKSVDPNASQIQAPKIRSSKVRLDIIQFGYSHSLFKAQMV